MQPTITGSSARERLPWVLTLTTLTMTAFAANSILCRLALAHSRIDPASFTSIRLVAGAVTLALIVHLRAKGHARAGDWTSAACLFAYAAAFSFAYLSLAAGTGALILFGAVQATMIVAGLARGERLGWIQTAGLILAVAGLVALLLPGATAPDTGGALLMVLAGVAWGAYSLRGRASTDPLATTAGNFLRASAMGVLLSAVATALFSWDPIGALWAVVSGAIASGLGYAVWYTVLPALGALQAASVQLSVPVIAALGGVLLLGERLSLRLAICAAAILGGIALVLRVRTAPRRT